MKKPNTIEKWTKATNKQVTEEQTKMAQEQVNRISQGNATRIPHETPFHIHLTAKGRQGCGATGTSAPRAAECSHSGKQSEITS